MMKLSTVVLSGGIRPLRADGGGVCDGEGS